MASDWRRKTVAELQSDGVLLVQDGNHGNDRPRPDEFAPVGVSFIRAADMDSGRVLFESAECINEAGRRRVRKGIGAGGDVLISHKGTVGKVAFVPLDAPAFVCSPQTTFWRTLDNDKLDRRFLFQFLNSRDFQNQLASRAGETDIAGYVSLTNQRLLEVAVPPPIVQRAIVDILGTLDDKIELNRRMNGTLEGMARALFQSWFVDFDPVRAKQQGRPPAGLDPATAELFPAELAEDDVGIIPGGWKRLPVGDLCEVNSWTLCKRDELATLEYVEISEVSRGNVNTIATYQRGDEPSRARRRLRHGDTVLSTVRPDRGAYFLALDPPANRIASTGFATFTPTKAPWAFVHAALTVPESFTRLGQLADGGAYPAVQPEQIGAWTVTIPNDDGLLQRFQDACGPLFERAEANRTQSGTLAALRDALLPKLLSGELSVAQAEDAAAAVAVV